MSQITRKRSDGKYVWLIYNSFDIFVSDLEGKIINQLTNNDGYDAEATVSPRGDKIVFTSIRSGDLELYTCNIDGSNVKQITNEIDMTGAFFSNDGKSCIQSVNLKVKRKLKNIRILLSQGLVVPTEMEIFTCNIDGSNLTQVTNLGKANWAPFFHPE